VSHALGRFRHVEPFHVPQPKRLAIVGRQSLQRRLNAEDRLLPRHRPAGRAQIARDQLQQTHHRGPLGLRLLPSAAALGGAAGADRVGQLALGDGAQPAEEGVRPVLRAEGRELAESGDVSQDRQRSPFKRARRPRSPVWDSLMRS
jgi:hypothetical protein